MGYREREEFNENTDRERVSRPSAPGPSRHATRRPCRSSITWMYSQPVSPCDDLQVRIAQRAYELHAERGYRQGYALEDWVEAEREILGQECSA